MYFFLANMLNKFHLLKYSLVVILTFVGLKLMAANYIHLAEWISLVVIALSLTGGIVASLVFKKKEEL
jgi:tellurite resistance protein TerC